MRERSGRKVGHRPATAAAPRTACRILSVAVLAVIMSLPLAAYALQKVPASRFEPASGCTCHRSFVETWGASMHAQALTDPLYRVKLSEANKASKGELGPYCETCHGPVAALGGLLGKKPGKRPEQANEGIGCDFCHQVSRSSEPIGDSSFVVTADGVKRGGLKDAVSPVHDSARTKFHRSAEFCGMCHDVSHPGNGLALEATYTEWKNGPYAEKGVVCQDCHMTPGPGVARQNPGRVAPFGVEREHVHTMTFVGGNTALGPAEEAEERLQAAAELAIETGEQIAASGEPVRFSVSVTNSGAGHYLPTGITELRRMWLEVVAVDASGSEVLRERRVFGTEFADAEGGSPAEMWEAVRVVRDDRIPPGATVTEQYETRMSASGIVKVTATLYYRGVPEDLAAKAGVVVPTTEMAKATASVYDSEDRMAEDLASGLPSSPLRVPLLALIAVVVATIALGTVMFAVNRRSAARSRAL